MSECIYRDGRIFLCNSKMNSLLHCKRFLLYYFYLKDKDRNDNNNAIYNIVINGITARSYINLSIISNFYRSRVHSCITVYIYIFFFCKIIYINIILCYNGAKQLFN